MSVWAGGLLDIPSLGNIQSLLWKSKFAPIDSERWHLLHKIMKLFWATSSPYSRKVRVVVREKGLLDEVEEIECNPFIDPPNLRSVNPLGKVPALVLPSGEALYDSPVICAYLDSLAAEEPALIPSGHFQWTVRRSEALADGLLDLAVGITVELRRAVAERSPSSIERSRLACHEAVHEMDRVLPDLPSSVNLGHIAFACACGYLDFRPESAGFMWRENCPQLAAWYEIFSTRASMEGTVPNDGTYQRFPASASK